MLCPHCAAENPDTSEVCFTCGRGLSGVIQGSVIASRYEVLSVLGQGGMGIVYKAHDRVLDEPVAIKVLRAEAGRESDLTRRFRTEIKLARRVRHENVCGIHEYGESGALHYIAMEFIDGVDLKQILRRDGSLPVGGALDLAIQVSDGLHAIHNVGIIHRDLKTANIMLDSLGRVRLMDFGIAKQWGVGPTTNATATGQVMGTPEYMSPEQARGERLDFRTDLYSLGIVIFELMTNTVPFRGDTPVSTLFKHVHEEPPLDGPVAAPIPADVRELIARLLAKDAEDRPANARQVASSLRGLGSRYGVDRASSTSLSSVEVPTSPSLPVPRDRTKPTVPVAAGSAQRRESEAATQVAASAEPLGVTVVEPPTSSSSVREAAPHVGGPWVRRLALPLSATALAAAGIVALVSRPASVEAPLPASAQASPREEPSLVASGPSADMRDASSSGSAQHAEPPPTPLSKPGEQALRPTPPVRADAALVASVPRPTARPVATPPPTASRRPRPGTTLPTLPLVPESAAAGLPAAAASSAPAASEPPISMTSAPPSPGVEAPTTPARQTGALQLAVVPYADVTVDGVAVGTTPMAKLALATGRHVVRLTHPSYEPLERVVEIRAGETTKLSVNLAREGARRKP